MVSEIRTTKIDEEQQLVVLHQDDSSVPTIVSVLNNSADFIYDVFCVSSKDNILDIIDISNALSEMLGGDGADYIDLVYRAII